MTTPVAFLSCDRLEGFFVYDQLAHAPLAERGLDVETVSWQASGVDWDRYAAVIVRSTWDYQDHPREFLRTLELIDSSRTRLFNPLELMRWNLDKRYLRDLQERGAEIVPTIFLDRPDREAIGQALGGRRSIVKPAISANADRTFVVSPGDEAALAAAAAAMRSDAVLVQPFMPAILDEGEYSLFYFGDRYSHAILKTPASGDFRVQEEHGGALRSVQPEPALLDQGERVLARLPGATLYARLDFVRVEADAFGLMEAELIEPSLYFQLDELAPARFADALVEALANSSG